MATEVVTVQAGHPELTAKDLWEKVERTVRSTPLHEGAPRCEGVRRMVYLHCWALCHKSTESDIQELWSAEADVEEFAGQAVAEPIKEMARHLMWSVQEECATGAVEVHLRSSSATHIERAHSLCDQQLSPHVGSERARAVWAMCYDCAWEVQRMKERRSDEAEAHRLWVEHHARRMAFDEDLAPLRGNDAVVALCYRLCRHWTSANATDGAAGHQELKVREAAFQIAMERAKEVVPTAVVDAIADLQRELRLWVHLTRLTDRKSPGQIVSNLWTGTAGRARGALEAAHRIRDEQLAPLLGSDSAKQVWDLCHSCTWVEQNRYDFESAIGGRITGARVGYLRDAWRDWVALLDKAAQMDFSRA